MKRDAVQAVADWISKEPESTEVIIIRRRGGQFHVKLEYGDRTTVPKCATDLAEALTAATEQANRLPSSARHYGERGLPIPGREKTFKPKTTKVEKKPVTLMPGMPPPAKMPGL